MFVSQEKNVGKKTFQKPNILRRKAKASVPRSNISNATESPATRSLVTSTNVDEASIPYQQYAHISSNEGSNISKPNITKKSVLKLTIANNNVVESDVSKTEETDLDANISSYATITRYAALINNSEKNVEQNTLNIDSFINGGVSEQVSQIDTPTYHEKNTTQAKTKWSFDLSNNAMDVMISNYNTPPLIGTEERLDTVVDIVPPLIPTTVQEPIKQPLEIICTPTPTRTISVELFSNRAVKFKCDEPNCNKGFWSEERLKKHKNSHNRQSTVRTPSQITIECPVKKVLEDGGEEKCPRTFQVRRELLKHLNADHTPEDALHRCEVCGRRFFWASGLRAHAQSVCARGGLACGWPGCTRVFRLPCRLREHARAHTGDRPYLCRFPDCGWAFRSASKLVRHARRHTDERRHVCGACGRAFLRREHLRDHAARHHHPRHRAPHLCTHPGCEQTFTNMSTLYMHMKRVHRKDETESAISAVVDQSATTVESGENIFLVSVVPEMVVGEVVDGDVTGGGGESLVQAEVIEEVGGAAGVEGVEGVASVAGEEGSSWHAARTHCTWPLAPRHHALHDHDDDHAFVLEEDVHVENAEGSASNVYTVRSDLFLHGNVPIDDDSQNIGVAELSASGEVAAPMDADLCLIDSHPTIDLMQEELMYEDAAVDESSFRVFF